MKLMAKKTDTESNKRFDFRFYGCCFIFIYVFLLLFAIILFRNSAGFDETETPFEEGWTYEDGSEANLGSLRGGKNVKISHPIDSEILSDDALCFESKNIYFSVYLDDEMIYDYRPAPPRLFGRSYGIFPHTVMIPSMEGEAVITIAVDSLYDKTAGFIDDIKLCNSTSYLLEKMQGSAAEFLLCLGVFSLGVVLFIIGMVGKYYGDKRYEIISLGTIAIVYSMWISTVSPIFAMITNAPVLVHFMNYMTLIFMPLPLIIFGTYLMRNKESRLPRYFAVLVAVNFVFSIVSNIVGFKDYHELLWISHANLILEVVGTIYLFIRGIVLKKIPKWVIITIVVTVFGPFAIGIAELIRYRLSPGQYDTTSLYKYTLFLFILVYGVYEFISISEMSKKSQYAEIMEKIAYTDSMTGLLNRSAFNNETEAAKKGTDIYTIVVMDMNHLKLVNDKMGHSMGDEYIITIGEIIREAYGKNGKCFRIGGDEFFAMTKKRIADREFQDIIGRMNQAIEKYNQDNKDKKHEYPLSIAIGFVEYNPVKMTFEEAFHLADENMYEQKKTMRMEVK